MNTLLDECVMTGGNRTALCSMSSTKPAWPASFAIAIERFNLNHWQVSRCLGNMDYCESDILHRRQFSRYLSVSQRCDRRFSQSRCLFQIPPCAHCLSPRSIEKQLCANFLIVYNIDVVILVSRFRFQYVFCSHRDRLSTTILQLPVTNTHQLINSNGTIF